MKIGYKGTDSEMKCRGFQYELGKEYIVTIDKKVVNVITTTENYVATENTDLYTCSSEVIHYCNNLEGCFRYYRTKENNRYFKIAVIGSYKDEKNKSCTKHIKFLEEVSDKDIEKAKERLENKRISEKLKLKDIRYLQSKFPNLILGGSLSLYLQGAKLKRLESLGANDFDMIHPYWVDLSTAGANHLDAKNSGNTFDDTFEYKGIKIDLSVNPNTRYTTVEFNGYKYKVNSIEQVLEYKIKYAQQKNGNKHKKDIRELLNIK